MKSTKFGQHLARVLFQESLPIRRIILKNIILNSEQAKDFRNEWKKLIKTNNK